MPPFGYKHSDETKRKISEANKRAWARRRAAERKSSIHIFYGHAARSSDPEDECMYCNKHYAVMAYTYFGAPVCGYHWDRRWRKEEDGKCDPPFNRIKTQVRGRWL